MSRQICSSLLGGAAVTQQHSFHCRFEATEASAVAYARTATPITYQSCYSFIYCITCRRRASVCRHCRSLTPLSFSHTHPPITHPPPSPWPPNSSRTLPTPPTPRPSTTRQPATPNSTSTTSRGPPPPTSSASGFRPKSVSHRRRSTSQFRRSRRVQAEVGDLALPLVSFDQHHWIPTLAIALAASSNA